MNYIDITIAVTVGIGMITGLRKGLVREVAGLVGLVAGIIGARICGPMLMPWLQENLSMTEPTARVVGWALCFIGLGMAINWVARFLTRTLHIMALGGVNKLLGAIFGGMKYILLFSVIFNLVTLAAQHVPVPATKAIEESVFYNPIKVISAWSLQAIKRIGSEEFNHIPNPFEQPAPNNETESEQPLLKTV